MMPHRRSAALLFSCALATSASFAQLSFSPKQAAPIPNGSSVAAHADFNNDGREDLAVTQYNSSTSSYDQVLYLSTADGTYDAPVTLPAFVQAIGDFNHDGKLDFASQSGSNPPSVYLGNGDGTFQAAKILPGPSGVIQSILAADVNHDSKTDLIELIAGASNGNLYSTLQILISNGDGTFTAGQSISTSTGPVANQQATGAFIGDFDGDGKPDIALIYGYVNQNSHSVPTSSTVQVWYGDGAGHFGSPIYLADPQGNFDSAAFVADLNNDGRSDIVTVSTPLANTTYAPYSQTLRLYFGNSNRTLSDKTITTSMCTGPIGTGITVADFNGDGINDLAYTAIPCDFSSEATSLFVRPGTGSGNFGEEENVYQNSHQLSQPLAVRTTLGTKPDIVFGQFNGTTTSSFELLTNESTGNFPSCDVSDLGEGFAICTPGTFSTSPVKFSLSAAGPTPMRTVAVWADGTKVAEQLTHAFSNYSFLDSSVALPTGSHAIALYGTGWDNTLQYYSFTLEVQAPCPAPSSPGLNVCSPVAGDSYSSPAPVQASATITGTLARMEVWVDGAKQFTETYSTSFNTALTLAAGYHRFDFYAVNTAGTKWEKTVYATVK
jgi:hypothetical protein